jgi:general secretion pathway protein G
MLVVIGIICLIAATLTPMVLGQMSHARIKAAQLQVDSVAAAVEAFRGDMHRLPTQSEGLAALVRQPAGADEWSGPYMSEKWLKDPWGRNLIYLPDTNGQSFVVESYGSTGKAGGAGAERTLKAVAE